MNSGSGPIIHCDNNFVGHNNSSENNGTAALHVNFLPNDALCA